MEAVRDYQVVRWAAVLAHAGPVRWVTLDKSLFLFNGTKNFYF